ncbi:outer membrane lipoprotein carrier protein [Haloferula luteola]|uniref:Outer membrane lipoprotein carrier protein n=1 Tax=Haloferula luteola TaxID=595692 RepID=A0A840V547_9BACT|nr:outer membrane lipoprotein carrier protein LolA [Haloferula luteola]MBB5353092.1 outer membrane lipoprotein carrier protein [Haloferula luteola]
MRHFLLCLGLTVLSAHADLDTAPLRAWLEAQKKVQSLDADFTQERTLPALKKPVSTPGRLTLSKPGKLRWDLGTPPKTIAVSDGETITLIDVEKKRAMRLDADSSRARSFTLLGDKALSGGLDGFTEAFELVESRVTEGIYQLTTRPKDRRMRDKVDYVFFDIDPKTQQLRALELRLDDKSRIRTIFRNTRLNAKVEADRFAVDLSGFKIH